MLVALRRVQYISTVCCGWTKSTNTLLRYKSLHMATAQEFIDKHNATLKPLEVAASNAWWDANVTGSDEAFQRKEQLQNSIDEILSTNSLFEQVADIHKNVKDTDPLVRRQIDILYRTYMEKHVDPTLLKRMVELSNNVEKTFNTFRAKVDGKELSNNEVVKILKESRDNEARRKAWEGSKAVGGEVQGHLLELVKIRNQCAVSLGFKHYHDMMLFLAEQDHKELFGLFDELDQLTRQPFTELKNKIEEQAVQAFGLASKDELRPWHYTDLFFQEAPKIGLEKVNVDQFFATQDILKLCRDFYASIGLPIDDVIARSDLYEKPGKSPHAFCMDANREGDVRVLANIVPDQYWMDTMLHELGHSVYSSKNMPTTLPRILRSESHILTTEGIAMMFGRLARSIKWVEAMKVAPTDEAYKADLASSLASSLRAQLLVFSRWCQVMLRFERAMYENPEQDLNDKWWSLVEEYQLIRRPPGRNAPDYASKIHIVSAPVYYHNYMMGEMFASQLLAAISRNLYNNQSSNDITLPNNPRVGEFLIEKVFAEGNKQSWNELTNVARYATGEYLNAKYFAQDFKG